MRMASGMADLEVRQENKASGFAIWRQSSQRTAAFLHIYSFFTYHIGKAKWKGILAMQDITYMDKQQDIPLAMAYVKWQRFDKVYDELEKAFKAGTIFPELNKPFTGRRCVS